MAPLMSKTQASFVFIISFMIMKTESLPKFKSILIFGDSLVDSGNNNYVPTLLTLGKANFPPYGQNFPDHIATGRFSNGLLMSDMLASALGIKDLVPPYLNPNLTNDELANGVCFASSGSGYDDLTLEFVGVLPISRQLKYFGEYTEKLEAVFGKDETIGILNSSLVVVFAGSNDMLFGPRRTLIGDKAFRDYILQRVVDFVKATYAKGIRNILVAGLSVDSMGYNLKLATLLSSLQAWLPGSKLVYADFERAISTLLANSSTNGITELDVPCCGGGVCVPGAIVCKNPDQYFKWDAVHPTQASYKIIIQYIIDESIPKFASPSSSSS